jgi:hypothetical protein
MYYGKPLDMVKVLRKRVIAPIPPLLDGRFRKPQT